MNESESQSAAIKTYLERFPGQGVFFKRGTFLFRPAPGPYLSTLKELGAAITGLQTDRGLADQLLASTVEVVDRVPVSMEAAVVFATKHREEVLYHLALAAGALAEGGLLLVVASNLLGSASLEKRLYELMGPVEVFCKHKCRVLSLNKKSERLNASLADQWTSQGSLRVIEPLGLFSAPGIFSWQKNDEGSKLLLDFLPSDLQGIGADLGAGLGFLSRGLLEKAPGVRAMTLVEIEGKALEAARLNLAPFEKGVDLSFVWGDVCQGLTPKSLDFVITNPPFHAGRGALPELGRLFIERALDALRSGGRLFLVANRHLPYEATLKSAGASVVNVLEDKGFKRIEAVRP